eukprot:5238399-Pyramimonas_sp.AAC.1
MLHQTCGTKQRAPTTGHRPGAADWGPQDSTGPQLRVTVNSAPTWNGRPEPMGNHRVPTMGHRPGTADCGPRSQFP